MATLLYGASLLLFLGGLEAQHDEQQPPPTTTTTTTTTIHAPLLMPEGHRETTPWAEGRLSVQIFSTTNVVFYTTDGSKPNTLSMQYNGSIELTEAGAHTIRAISYKEGRSSKEVSALYRVAAIAKGTAYDGYLEHCRVGLDLKGDRTFDEENATKAVTGLDSYGRAWYKLLSLEGLESIGRTHHPGENNSQIIHILLLPDPPSRCLCGIPRPICCCDVAMGIPQMLSLRAPATSRNLNPVTTVLSHLMDEGLGEARAERMIKESWGLPEAYSILGDDVLWLSLHSYLDVADIGPVAYIRLAQAEVILCCVAMLLAGSSDLDWPDDRISSAVYAGLAQITREADRSLLNFTSVAFSREVAVRAASHYNHTGGGPSTLEDDVLGAVSKMASHMALELDALMEVYLSAAGKAGQKGVSATIPLDIAEISRDTNTQIGQDIWKLSRGLLSVEGFDLKYQKAFHSDEGADDDGVDPASVEVEVDRPSSSASMPANRSSIAHDENVGPMEELGYSGGIQTWQMALVVGLGAPLLVALAVFIVIKRRRKRRAGGLLDLIEIHNLIEPDVSDVYADKGKSPMRAGGYGDLPSSSSPSSSASSSGRPSYMETSNKDTFFDESPPRIHHRPPKRTNKIRRETMQWDNQSESWKPFKEAQQVESAVAELAPLRREEEASTSLHTISEGENEGRSRPPTAEGPSLKHPPLPPAQTPQDYKRKARFL